MQTVTLKPLTLKMVEVKRKEVVEEAPSRKHCPKCKRERDIKFYGTRAHKNAAGKTVRVTLQSYCVDCRSGKVIVSQPAKAKGAKKSAARAKVGQKVKELVAKGKASIKKPAKTEQPAEVEEVVVMHAPSDPATETLCGATDGKIALGRGIKLTCEKCIAIRDGKRKPKAAKTPKATTKPVQPETTVEVVAAPTVEQPSPAEQVEAERVAKQQERERLMAAEETAQPAEMAF